MNGTNIQQLGTLHATVKELIPVLQKYDQTAAYGDWLQMRLDDLEAADEMERALPQPAPGAITQTSPSQKLARKIWAQRMDKRFLPWPAQAKAHYVAGVQAGIRVRARAARTGVGGRGGIIIQRRRAQRPAGAAGDASTDAADRAATSNSRCFPSTSVTSPRKARARRRVICARCTIITVIGEPRARRLQRRRRARGQIVETGKRADVRGHRAAFARRDAALCAESGGHGGRNAKGASWKD